MGIRQAVIKKKKKKLRPYFVLKYCGSNINILLSAGDMNACWPNLKKTNWKFREKFTKILGHTSSPFNINMEGLKLERGWFTFFFFFFWRRTPIVTFESNEWNEPSGNFFYTLLTINWSFALFTYVILLVAHELLNNITLTNQRSKFADIASCFSIICLLFFHHRKFLTNPCCGKEFTKPSSTALLILSQIAFYIWTYFNCCAWYNR